MNKMPDDSGNKNYDPALYSFVQICAASDVPEGGRIFFDVGDQAVVLLNISGKYFAIGDICSHDDGPLGEGEVEGCEIICPRHGARFDLLSGKATRSPAFTDIPWFPVRLVDGMLEIGVKL